MNRTGWLNQILALIWETLSQVVNLYNTVWLFGLAFAIWVTNYVIDRFVRLKHR